MAHILLDIEQELTQELYTRGGRRIDLAAMRAGLSDASQWLRSDSYPGPLRAGDAWRVEDVIRNLQEKAELINPYHQDGWPDDGASSTSKTEEMRATLARRTVKGIGEDRYLPTRFGEFALGRVSALEFAWGSRRKPCWVKRGEPSSGKAASVSSAPGNQRRETVIFEYSRRPTGW